MPRLSDFNFNNTEKNHTSDNSNFEQDIYQKYNQYKDLSESELNRELLNEVARQKSNGSFDYNRLASMLESIRGALGEDNYQNMKRILESLKWFHQRLIKRFWQL